jgi:carbamoylphosphate synthase large subunit
VDEISRHVADVNACAIIPGDTIATRLLVAIRDRLPVRTCLLPTAAVFDQFNDKWLFFQYCRRIGIRVPDSRRVAGSDAVLRGLADGTFRLPLVVKPRLGMASSGVHILRHERDIRRLLDVPPTQSGPLLVQTFIEGTDRGISVVARAGTVVAYAAQTVHDRRHDLTERPDLRAMAERIVATSGFDGAANFDAVEEAASGDCYILECNPRFWFSIVALLAAGLNMVAHSLAEDGGAVDRPATVTRPMVPLGRAAITDVVGFAWTPALFAVWRYYLRDIPGVLCGQLPAFQNRRPGRGDIPDQMRQLADLSCQTSASAAAAE